MGRPQSKKWRAAHVESFHFSHWLGGGIWLRCNGLFGEQFLRFNLRHQLFTGGDGDVLEWVRLRAADMYL